MEVFTLKYDFANLEPKWQQRWEEAKVYAAEEHSDKPKFYGLVEFPYPSGQGLHVGHPRPYTAMDIVARKKRMDGYNVLYPMGFDGAVELCIDHHGSNNGFAAMGYVEGARAACGEIIYDLLLELGIEVDSDMADVLSIAITTDTGCFRYSNTTAGTLRTAAALMFGYSQRRKRERGAAV